MGAVDKAGDAEETERQAMIPREISRFTDLSIHGFRRLLDVQLPLRPLSVMIGANGTGKTSVLDVFSLLAKSAQGKLSESISEFSGLSSILTYDRAEELRLGISMLILGHEALMDYSLNLKPQSVGYLVNEERLSEKNTGDQDSFLRIYSRGADVNYFRDTRDGQGLFYYEIPGGSDLSNRPPGLPSSLDGLIELKSPVHPNWEYKPLESSLSQVPKMFRQPEEFRNRLASSTLYHALNVDPRSPVRLPQPMQPATLPGRNGEDLFPASSISGKPRGIGSRLSKILFALPSLALIVSIFRPWLQELWPWLGVRRDSPSLSICTSFPKGRCASFGWQPCCRVPASLR
jgi:hypothetical protein